MARRPRKQPAPPFYGFDDRPFHGAIQEAGLRLSYGVREIMKRTMGVPLGAVFAHGVGMHNPKNGIDCHPDPECPTCRRERSR